MTNPSLTEWWPEQPLAVVIGAGGMGTAVARRLGHNHQLLLVDIASDRLEVQADKLREEGMQVATQVCDVTDPDAVAALAARAGELGNFAALAHVAGLSPSMADWRTILAVNLVGPALMTEALLPVVRPGAAAVLISSLSAHLRETAPELLALLDQPLAANLPERLDAAVPGGMTSQLAYMLSKVGVMRLARRQALAWGARGGRVNSLSPGLIATPQGINEFKHATSKVELLKRCPLQRQGSMQEIAAVVAFLLSRDASYISGIDLLVDGGNLAGVQLAK